MRTFYRHKKYDGSMDPEVIPLCDAINMLPGIRTFESCCGHGKAPFMIFMRVSTRPGPRELRQEGLFFLTRCVDFRYWKYGSTWKIELQVGEVMSPNGDLPVIYMLHSGDVRGAEAYDQANDLLQNMVYHLNHKNFMRGYRLLNYI